jgi:hypothetical protein
MEMFLRQVRDNQNLGMAIFGGLAAALIGALIWALITAVSGYQIGFMAIGVGFLVGTAVRLLGKGIDLAFSIVGALFSLIGCLIGNLLTICILVASDTGAEVLDIVSGLDLATAIEMLKETFNPMDLIFYAIAVYYGYRYSLRVITPEELGSLTRH